MTLEIFVQDYNFNYTFFLPPPTRNENKEGILGLKLSGGANLEVPVNMLKIIIGFISVPLSNIFTSV